MNNVKFSYRKFNINNNRPGITVTAQQTAWNGSEINEKKTYYQQSMTNNIMYTDNTPLYHFQTQLNNQKFNDVFPTRNSQTTSKHVINSYSSSSFSLSQRRKKNVKSSSSSTSTSSSKLFQNLQDPSTRQNNNNRSKSHSQQKTYTSLPTSRYEFVSIPSQIPYAPKNEVPAGLPPTLFASRQIECDFQSSQQQSQYNSMTINQEQSQIRRLSFESSGCCCCKSLSTKSDESELSNALQFFVVKLPGMKQFIPVPKCAVKEKEHDEVRVFSPKMHVDQQPVIVKLPGMMNNNSVLLCDEPWWLSSKESTALSQVVKKDCYEEDDDGNTTYNDNENYDNVNYVEEDYESASAIEFQLDVTPIVNLPPRSSTSLNVKFDQRKDVEYFNDYYCHVTTSDNIEFDKESPVVQLHPKPVSSSRFNPNLKIETNLKLDKDDEDRFLISAGCSTLSTPVSETSSSSFSNTSTYAESENTVFTEEEIINETKSCNVPEGRSPSVLSNSSSEHLTPVLEEEEDDDSKMILSTSLSVEERQQEMSEEFLKLDMNEIHSPSEIENENFEYQETQECEDPQEIDKEQVEFVLPELREIAKQLEKLQSDSNEAIRIRRQLETINRDNYPDSLPLSNKWTMYFADTSVTKTNTRVISKNKYSSTLNPIFECTTVPALCSNLREFSSKIKPSDMKTNVNLSFFKGNIMPMWEDEANNEGGRFTLCPPRSQLNSLWNSIVLLLAGEAIDDSNLICGAVCARRDRGDRVELWISGGACPEAIDHIRDLLAEELGNETVRNVKYKRHLGKP